MKLGGPVSKSRFLFCKKLLTSDRFFCVSIIVIKESLLDLCRKHNLFLQEISGFGQVFLLSLKKMGASEEEIQTDSFAERYRYSDFLSFKNDQYKIVDSHFFVRQHVEKYPLTNLLGFD